MLAFLNGQQHLFPVGFNFIACLVENLNQLLITRGHLQHIAQRPEHNCLTGKFKLLKA
ncbi:hypothetical protein D3C80_1980950 [compost metagenome]